MVLRLPDLVASPLSVNALREDLQLSHKTVARWLMILENLYMIFRIYPFGAPKIRAVKKEAKHYHLDWTVVKDIGARFENLTACHLLKWCHFMEDTAGRGVELRYFRDIHKIIDVPGFQKNHLPYHVFIIIFSSCYQYRSFGIIIRRMRIARNIKYPLKRRKLFLQTRMQE